MADCAHRSPTGVSGSNEGQAGTDLCPSHTAAPCGHRPRTPTASGVVSHALRRSTSAMAWIQRNSRLQRCPSAGAVQHYLALPRPVPRALLHFPLFPHPPDLPLYWNPIQCKRSEGQSACRISPHFELAPWRSLITLSRPRLSSSSRASATLHLFPNPPPTRTAD